MHAEDPLAIGWDGVWVHRGIKPRCQICTSPSFRNIIVSTLTGKKLRKELMHPTILFNVLDHSRAIGNHPHTPEHASRTVGDRLKRSRAREVGQFKNQPHRASIQPPLLICKAEAHQPGARRLKIGGCLGGEGYVTTRGNVTCRVPPSKMQPCDELIIGARDVCL